MNPAVSTHSELGQVGVCPLALAKAPCRQSQLSTNDQTFPLQKHSKIGLETEAGGAEAPFDPFGQGRNNRGILCSRLVVFPVQVLPGEMEPTHLTGRETSVELGSNPLSCFLLEPFLPL